MPLLRLSVIKQYSTQQTTYTSEVPACETRLVTSLAKEIMFWGAFVCLFVCGQLYSKSYEPIGMDFYGGVLGSTTKNWLNFGGDLGILRWVNEQENTIIVVAYPGRGAGNDPEPLGFAFHHQGSTLLHWEIWE